jgi:hypothetical protein
MEDALEAVAALYDQWRLPLSSDPDLSGGEQAPLQPLSTRSNAGVSEVIMGSRAVPRMPNG